MKKQLFSLLLLGMILLSASSVSALELNPFADVKKYEPVLKGDMSNFIKEDFNSKYGVIRLSKTFFWIETDKIAEYSLTKNTEQCLINCEAEGKAILYRDMGLFDDMKFYDKFGRLRDLDYKIYIFGTEEYVEETPIYSEVCEDVTDVKNGTKNKVCQNVQIDVNREIKTREVWKEYNNEVLPAGNYKWKLEGKKKPTESIDFIPVASSKELSEWAWWNSAWLRKKQINITGGSATLNNFTVFIKVTYNSSIKEDYGDIRFLDSSSANELYYYRENYNSSEAYFHVLIPSLNPGNNVIYMYYKNPEATTTSNAKNTFPINRGYHSIFTLNNSNSKDIILSLDVADGGQIKNTNLFDGGVQLVSNRSLLGGDSTWNGFINEYNSWAWDLWIYPFNYSSTGDNGIIGFTRGGCDNVGFQPDIKINSTGTIFGQLSKNCICANVIIGPQIALNSWTHLVYKYNSSDKTYELWVNGVKEGSRVFCSGSSTAYAAKLPLGSTYGGTEGITWGGTAIFDMLKVYNSTNTLSTAWISRTYQNSNSSSYIFGAEESLEGVSVSLSSPANAFKSSSQTIFFNATITPVNANITNVTWKAGSQTDFQTYNTNATITPNWTKTFADGSYSWNVTACWIGVSETESCTESATRTFEIDSLAPNLTLNAPLTNFTTLTLPINVTLNFTASDSNLQACWFSSTMNSTNTTFTCNTTQTREFNSSGAHSFTYYANDTFGGVSTGTAPFYIYYVQPSATATNPITEGGTSTHTLFVNMTNIKFFPTSAYLIWNGTNLGTGTLTNVSNDSVRFDKTFVVPSINGTLANWTWFYNISGNPNVQNWNVSGSQTYISINISECGAGTYRILNYTLYDQKTKVISPGTNASIEVDLTLTSYANSSQTWQFHTTKTASNNLLICLPSGALNNSAYRLDSIAKYSYQDHVVQYHYIVNFNLNSTTIPQSIKLYNLATEQSTSFLVNYQDENYLYVEDAIIDVWRRYVGDGVFLSVEHGKTDAQGQTRLHLVTEDIIYKFLVWINGELVYTSPEYLALCQATPCQINLRKTINKSNGFSERDNILYSYSFDKTTRTATFDFTTKDGTETTINMTILSSNAYANNTACTTTLTTSGGQISCAIPTAFTNTSYQTLIYKDGVFFGQSTDSLAPSSMELFGYTSVVLTAIAYLFLALMGISSGIAIIVFGLIGLVLMGIIQMFESGSIFGLASAIIWLVVAGIIIIVKITKRRIQ